MFDIIPAITLLQPYLNSFKNNLERFRLEACPTCKMANPWLHGTYPRKPDRDGGDTSLNPVPIQRFYCSGCGHTSSVLPECMPPRRWYQWHIQQIALLLYLSGLSMNAVSKEITPCRQTITRWVNRFKEKFLPFKNALSTYAAHLGYAADFSSFWRMVLSQFSLGEAMRLCHLFGEAIV